MYILEGTIGAGKSTFLRLLEQHLPHVSVALEPMQWQNQIYGQSLLANFYQEPKRWAYTLETLTMVCRIQDHLKEQNNPNPNRVLERSIYSGCYCFGRNSYENDYMNATEWHMYQDWFTFLTKEKCKPPLGFIYLKVDPEIAFERIKKRNRLAEKKLTLAYLKQIDRRHQEFLIHKAAVLPEIETTPVLVLDCNEEFETNVPQLRKHLKEVEEFLAITKRPDFIDPLAPHQPRY